MRVAVFTDNDFSTVNGVTTTLGAVLDHAPADVRPRVYTAASLGCDQPDYFAVRSMALRNPFDSGTQIYVPKRHAYLNRVRDDRVSLVHLTTPGPLGLTALWVANQSGLPLVGSFHSDVAACSSTARSPRLSRWIHSYLRWMYGRCQAVLVSSLAMRVALTYQGWPAERLVIWPRGVDTVRFNPARYSSVLSAAWRSDRDHPVVLYAGRVSRDNGVDLLPPMLRRLRSRGLACRLVVAGDGPYRRHLAESCPEAILAGTLGREELAETFASADVFVLPRWPRASLRSSDAGRSRSNRCLRPIGACGAPTRAGLGLQSMPRKCMAC